MAAFLIDYENVYGSNGLDGIEYLEQNDILYIFYGQTCPKIKQKYVNFLTKIGCEFKAFELKKTGKNALDFCIVSECGALVQRGENQIAIVSKDQGYVAARDFLNEKYKCHIVLSSNIEKGIVGFNTNKSQKIAEDIKMVSLSEVYGRLEERSKMREKLLKVFRGTEYENSISQIMDYLSDNTNSSNKTLYIDALHKFGRKDGTKIYQLTKKVI